MNILEFLAGGLFLEGSGDTFLIVECCEFNQCLLVYQILSHLFLWPRHMKVSVAVDVRDRSAQGSNVCSGVGLLCQFDGFSLEEQTDLRPSVLDLSASPDDFVVFRFLVIIQEITSYLFR